MRAPRLCTPANSRPIHVKPFALTLAAAASFAVAGLLLGGCDVARAKADRAAQENVQAAQAKDPADLKALEQAANNDVTDATKVYAKTALADAEVDAARSRLHEIDEKEIRIARILGEMTSLAARIEANNAAITGYKQRLNLVQNDIKNGLQTAAASIQGSGNQATWPQGLKVEGKLPTLSATEAEVKRIQGEIATLEGQQKDLDQQRQQAENQAAELFRQADRARGREGVQVFTRASQQQKQAADLATQVAATEAKLMPLRQQLALAQRQQELLNKAVGSFQKQLQQTEAGAQQVQKLIDDRTALSQAIVNAKEPAGAAAAPATQPAAEGAEGAGTASAFQLSLPKAGLAAKAAELNQLTQDVTAARQAVEEQLNNALKHYKEAASIAGQLYRQASENAGKPGSGREAWQAQMEAYHPAVIDLQSASAQMLLASVWRDAATALADRQQAAEFVQAALKSAGIQAPQGVGDPAALGQEVAAAQKNAQEQYDGAIELLSKAEGGGGGPRAARASVAHVVALYGRSLALRASNPQEADKSLQEARNLVKEAGGGGGGSGGAEFPLSVLQPLGLGPKVDVGTTAPATQGATTQPATQPEGAAATQPAAGGGAGQ
jgi:chromosome segregation ATPase